MYRGRSNSPIASLRVSKPTHPDINDSTQFNPLSSYFSPNQSHVIKRNTCCAEGNCSALMEQLQGVMKQSLMKDAIIREL